MSQALAVSEILHFGANEAAAKKKLQPRLGWL